MAPNPSFHFFTLVTNTDQYEAMRASLAKSGFDETNALFTIFDNRERNEFEPFSAVSRAVKEARAPFVVFCHQDLMFDQGPAELRAAIAEVEAIDPKWAILGNAGQMTSFMIVSNFDSPHGPSVRGDLPARVLTFDENFLVIKRDSGLDCSPEISGFHLYATDLCWRAYERGFTAYVLNFKVLHVGGTLGYPGLHEMAWRFHRVWRRKIRGAVLFTPCMLFIFSRVPFLFAATNREGMHTRLMGRLRLARTLDFLLRYGRPAWLPMGRYREGDPRDPRRARWVRALDALFRLGRPLWPADGSYEEVVADDLVD